MAAAAAPLAGACGGSTLGDASQPTPQSTPPVADASTVTERADGAVVVISDGGVVTTGFDSTVCNESYEPLTDVSPKGGADYLELRIRYDFGQDAAGTPANVAAKNGTPCATATNKTKCQADLAALDSGSGWNRAGGGSQRPSSRYLVFTRGDQVGLVDTLDELATFLAPVDTVKDARARCSRWPSKTRSRVACAKRSEPSWPPSRRPARKIKRSRTR